MSFNYFVFVVIMQFRHRTTPNYLIVSLLDLKKRTFTVFESKAYTVSLAGCRIEDCYVGNLNSGFFSTMPPGWFRAGTGF